MVGSLVCYWFPFMSKGIFLPAPGSTARRQPSHCSIAQGYTFFQEHPASRAWSMCYIKPWSPHPNLEHSEGPFELQSSLWGGLRGLFETAAQFNFSRCLILPPSSPPSMSSDPQGIL